MSETDKLLSHPGQIQFSHSARTEYYDDDGDSTDNGTDIDFGDDAAHLASMMPGGRLNPEQIAQMQKYRKRARRTHRRRVIGAGSRTSTRKLDSLRGGLPLIHPHAEVSTDEEEEEEEANTHRVSAYCTCDTYLISAVYNKLAEVAQIPHKKPAAETKDASYMYHSYQHDYEALNVDEQRNTLTRSSRNVVNTVLRDVLAGCRVTLTYYGSDVLLFKIKDGEGAYKHLFVFEYGCLAFFNFSLAEEHGFIALLSVAEEDTLSPRERECGIEDMCYTEGGSLFQVQNDTITLASDSSLEKLSVAFAMAQCVKLNVFEERIDEEIEKNRDLPESLAARGTIELSRTEMARKIGKLFIERNNVNLHADILDDPEFFWEQDRHKHVYEKLFKYLELGRRVGLLNRRLDILQELYNMLSDQLDNSHSQKLEYIIIYLILIEVVITVGWQIILKDIFGFFQH